jgi:hypothetical protein
MRNFNIAVRQFRDEDAEDLDKWRQTDPSVLLEVPHGYMGTHVETAVVEKDGEKLLSLTGTIAAIFDPLIKNPDASRLDIMEALIKAEAALAYVASKVGAQDAYISIPEEQVAYRRIVERYGYTRILEGCAIYKKMLVAPLAQTPTPEETPIDVELTSEPLVAVAIEDEGN